MPSSRATVTLALGLRSTAQGLGVIGKALGLFAAEGLDLQVVREETAGPEGLRGLVEGDYQFAEFGAVPVVQAAAEGLDAVILLAAEPVSALYVLGRRGVDAPSQLAGGRIGVLSRAGQTGHSAQRMLERWGLQGQADLVPLGTYPAIYQQLATGAIDAGVLTADYRIAGEMAHGLRELADLGAAFGFQGPVLATTRRLCRSDAELVRRVVRAYVRSIAAFAARPEEVVPLLRDHLRFPDLAQARAIHAFYAPRFQVLPRASEEGIARVIASLAQSHSGAQRLTPAQVHAPGFIDSVVMEGS